jgi:hypothetical protein
LTPQLPSDSINDSPEPLPATDIKDAANAAEEGDPASIIRYVLAAAWVLLPAIQYLATYQRTDLQVNGQAFLPSLADLDLTTPYLFLLLFTVLYALARWAAGRRSKGPASEHTA